MKIRVSECGFTESHRYTGDPPFALVKGVRVRRCEDGEVLTFCWEHYREMVRIMGKRWCEIIEK